MAKVSKTTITFTVLHPADEPLSNSLGDVLGETEYGNAVGLETARETATVPDEAVISELIALHNDGSFFDDVFRGDDDNV